MSAAAAGSRIGVLVSGGLDSAILLRRLLDLEHVVQPFYIQSHLHWQRAERGVLHRYLDRLATPRLAGLVELELPLVDLYGDHWSVTGQTIPDDRSPDEAVFLPGRNALLLLKAALWCQMHGIEELALATLSSNPFADASDDFFTAIERALNLAETAPLRIVRPFGRLTKRQVMQFGREMPLELTFSCIDPVDTLHCGRCNKCAERRAAFGLIEAEDPTVYAPATGVPCGRGAAS